MKKILVLLLLSVVSSAVFAQLKSKATPISYSQVIPGKGVGELVLGISTEKAIEILGVPEKSLDYDQEQFQEVVKFGKNISQELCYNTHYDRVFKYKNDCNAKIDYPVYKLYFRKNQLVYIVLTSYGYDDLLYNKFTALNKIGFYSSGEKIKSVLGHPEINEERYVGEYLYMKRGIDFITENNEMRAMFIYEPLENEVAQAIMEMSGH